MASYSNGDLLISSDWLAANLSNPNVKVVDTRGAPRYAEGHIPGAVNIPWPLSVNEDGTFKSAKDLEKLYVKGKGLKRRSPTIAYCRIGERSSLTWFVLTYLLGFAKVKNYDGSWMEWGNCVGVPVVKG